jgi:hypothetical protein
MLCERVWRNDRSNAPQVHSLIQERMNGNELFLGISGLKFCQSPCRL